MADPRLDDVLSSITSLAQGAKASDEPKAPGPGDVQPTINDKGNPLISIPFGESDIKEAWQMVKDARQRRDQRSPIWDILLEEYLPIVSKTGEAETVRTNAHFRNVHTKLGQLFYRSPDLILQPKEPSPAQNTMPNPLAQVPPGQPPPMVTMEDIIVIKQAILQSKLGRDGLKAERLMDELLFDVLAWSGLGCCKVGYLCVQKSIQKPRMGPAPVQPGSVLGIGGGMMPQTDPATGQPLMDTVQANVYENYYARRFSPKKALFDWDLKSTRFDEDATWTGMEFFISKRLAARAFKIDEKDLPRAEPDIMRASYKEDSQGMTATNMIHGVELWRKASYFRDDEVHPLAVDQLILLEGLNDKPVVYRPSPDQTFGPEGRLSPDSVEGFPLRFMTIRDLADSPFPPSDSAFTNSLNKQLNTWRQQSVKLRDKAIGKLFIDLGAIGPEEKDKIENGNVGEIIGLEAGKLAQGADKIMAATPQPHQTNDDVRNQSVFKQDMDETLGISGPQSGTVASTVHSATEINTVERGSEGRADKERDRVVDFYLDIARMVDQLLMRYATTQEYVQIVGKDGALKLALWNNALVSGRYLYEIAPDSQLKADTARDFQLALNHYNLTARDPLSNRQYLLRKLARMRGYDPSKAVIVPQPQQPQPPKPNVSIALKAEDLILAANTLVMNPNDPAAKIILSLAEQATIAPEAPAQPPHGGEGNAANKHEAAQSGRRPNEPNAGNVRQGGV